jgi:mannose-6-phosphate isomerase
MADILEALRLSPHYHERVWGGSQLKAATPPIGEAWIVHEHNTVADGVHAGSTLADLARRYGKALLGSRAMALTGERFPLLIKLLDTADWLSLQVHPNDEQARQLEGADQMGKTEAWYILQTEGDAQLIAGLRPGTSEEALNAAIANGTILDVVHYERVEPGDTIFIRAGTIHALGPGLLLYEVQQTSDITYRVYDWDRPQSAGRALHIDKSMAVADAGATGDRRPQPALQEGMTTTLIRCPQFKLQLSGGTHAVEADTQGISFHAVTVIEGAARIEGAGKATTLGRYETAVVPASWGTYRLVPEGSFRALTSSID